MTDKRIPLALAAFMDSAHAVRLPAPASPEIRKIVERLLEACYGDLGRPPEELDSDALGELFGRWLPSRFDPGDPLLEWCPAVIEAFFEHLDDVAVVAHSFDLKMGLPGGVEAFLATATRNETPRRRSSSEVGTVVHKATKTGRNDPCPCGSGKKFKRCHGT